MRGLILAVQFLTRLPTPQLKDFKPEWLTDSARWFPAVGVIVGALLLASLSVGARIDPWLAALLALVCWVAVTGGLHLDGLADLADALGASHRSRERFFEVLKDPHLGSFGVLSLLLAVIAKLVLLMLLAKSGQPAWGLLLIPAWARAFAVAWSASLPAIAPGSGERFAWRRDWAGMGLNLAALLALSAWLAPALLLAPLAGLSWRAFLKRRLGGMTGDCLGAGVELCEIALLAALFILPALYPALR
ncbi:adenosylcobinamide-GDP ribazoletransferase [Chromobacterium sp. IIBBL 290-4]|uniref:adenosylcobinamide-GDP ribazoletransferase n=1 Tax=Chromobacterium sp. IIBBL 290-4 TaxID=2953890 RepID=UPI0020B8634A|nr:adenosylcobinamide-GDP ribazoletransferase [Chromobacterium sp. IIBBL 290-4]UTH76175.1 adenosylcobinamide-GDP ribazoletransferase [Chromobacterium sp. IIBBL 290-4]